MIKPGASEYLLFDSVGITGILVERASWWNGHLGGTGILPVSFPDGLSELTGALMRKNRANQGLCVTGRTIPTLATRRKIRASPPLTHPTHLVCSTQYYWD
ncbi:MAG: hypothetical protein F6K44_28375 [Moorea sp. SIO3E2]|nr:hypothetical protein [Moorena sp. SIO3E2]